MQIKKTTIKIPGAVCYSCSYDNYQLVVFIVFSFPQNNKKPKKKGGTLRQLTLCDISVHLGGLNLAF